MGVALSYSADLSYLCKTLWQHHFKWPLDTLGLDYTWASTYQEIRKYYFQCEWYEVYDFIEFVANNFPKSENNKSFMNCCNQVLKSEVSSYRFIGGKITKITSEEEIAEIEKTLNIPSNLKPVRNHIAVALKLLSDRKSPDYRNSIKESISAVEGICKLIEGNPKSTLGRALNKIESKISIHSDLKDAFKNLYGYTCDSDGIRHALMNESNLDFEDAKFMLVSCSAFINYLIVKSSKAGIKI